MLCLIRWGAAENPERSQVHQDAVDKGVYLPHILDLSDHDRMGVAETSASGFSAVPHYHMEVYHGVSVPELR